MFHKKLRAGSTFDEWLSKSVVGLCIVYGPDTSFGIFPDRMLPGTPDSWAELMHNGAQEHPWNDSTESLRNHFFEAEVNYPFIQSLKYKEKTK